METAWEYLQRLCRHPHRGSATEGEAAAARDLRRWLEEMGYSVELQPFRAPRDTLYLGPFTVMVGSLIAARLGESLPWAALLLCGVLLIPMVGEMLGSRVDFDLLLPRYPSQNVVARLPRQGSARQTVVVCAHYDTQRASYLFHPALAPYLQRYFYLVYASLLAIPAGVALGWALPGAGWPTWVMGAGASLTLLNAVFLMACRRSGRYVNGANDNGSGAALLLALARRWAQDPAPETQLIVALTGCEEVGTRGMKRFLATCGLDPATTCFINLDNLGSGRLHYMLGEGMLGYKPYGARLIEVARRLGEQEGLQPCKKPLLPTDGVIPARAGYEAITFLALREDGRLPDYHWYTDRPDRIDPDHLARCERFLWSYLLGVIDSRQESHSCKSVTHG